MTAVVTTEADSGESSELSQELYASRKAALSKRLWSWPLESNDIAQFAESQVLEHMRSAYPLVHGSLLVVFKRFLEVKRELGSAVEKALYKDMDLCSFVDRFFSKRPLAFLMKHDGDLLRDGDMGASTLNYKLWDRVGSEEQSGARVLADYMSYDEMLLSAMCGVSSRTHFINDGRRENRGQNWCDPKCEDGSHEHCGVYTALVGCRFERDCKMECVHLAVTKSQNTRQNGFGPLQLHFDESKAEETVSGNPIWRVLEEFYGMDHVPLHSEVLSAKRSETADFHQCAIKWGGDLAFLNVAAFRMRMTISAELFLFDAQKRVSDIIESKLLSSEEPSDAKTEDSGTHKGAYCHVVALGTGVWAIDKRPQQCAIVEQFKEVIERSDLRHVAAVDFSYFSSRSRNSLSDKSQPIFSEAKPAAGFRAPEYYCCDGNGHRIEVFFSGRNPAAKLKGEFEDCLSVAMFSWDGNAFPGNEYWLGRLSDSGDPAAACCSTISYVQNPEINCEHINGRNATVFFADGSHYKLSALMQMDESEWIAKSLASIPCGHRCDGTAPQTMEDYIHEVESVQPAKCGCVLL